MSEDLSLQEIRLQKLERLRELGLDPFRVERFNISDSAAGLLNNFKEGKDVSFAGRVVSYRLMGKAGFAHLSDGDGKIQFYCKKDEIPEAQWEAYQLLDVGDHVGVYGTLFITKTGERSIHAQSLTPLSKALQPLPLGKEKEGRQFSALTDVEVRYRHRHLDLLANPEARATLVNRMKIVRSVRNYFDSLAYLEVETPVLQLEAGGAAARPFQTHINAYDLDVKLRISLELYLKRLICGDLHRVYEIGRVFRNEGISQRHNPEFTLLEFYEAYADLEIMMQRVEECFAYVSREVFETTVFTFQDEEGALEIDFAKPWRRLNLLDEIHRLSGVSPEDLATLESAKAKLSSRIIVNPLTGKRVDASEETNLGGLIEKLLEVFVEPTLVQPTFVLGYPIETSPLAKKDPTNPRMTRRFEGYVRRREICNAFSEINDPIDQRERFEKQVAERARGDHEAHPMDEEFLYALECGMPPTGGCGIGMDRMAMLLTGQDHIREVLLFPFMRPSVSAHDEEGTTSLATEA